MSSMPMRCLLLLIAIMPAGCGAPRIDTTRLGSADLVAMTDQMTASLLSSDAVASRAAQSPPWIITMDRVSNQTSDIITDGEKWAFMARLRSQLNNSPAMRDRNIRFVLSRRAAEQVEERYDDRLVPTHTLAATFYSTTTYAKQLRSDTYLCAFQLMAIDGDRLVWEDSYEVKYATVRNKFD